ncbi:glycosyltransferase family 39 protein [Alphaproteobacteria bacterium]|nr:glycosyltransferase family 39 protein [Alphaproteobacteria bacterium]
MSAQIIFWTLIPYLSNQALPLDVIREGLSWGQEWRLGYYKHPPLVSWITNISYVAFGDLGPYFLSQIFVALTYYYSYKTSEFHLSQKKAFLATLLLLGVYYFSWPTPEFNHNVAQMPIWASLIFLFHKVIFLRDQRAWIFSGAVIGIGALVKYSVLILPVLMLFYLMASRKILETLKSWELYVGIALAILIICPHAVWLFQNDFITFQYLNDRAGAGLSKIESLIGGLKFLLAQIADHLPMFLALGFAGLLNFKSWRLQKKNPQNLKVLWLFGLGPCFLTIVISIATGMGLRDMWGAPMWSLSGTLVMVSLSKSLDGHHYRKIVFCFGALFLMVAILYGISNKYGSLFSGKLKRTDWPAVKISESFEKKWISKTNCPLSIVAGENWLAGLVSAKTSGRPSVWIDADFQLSPWITQDRLQNEGALLLWLTGDSKHQKMLRKATEFGLITIEKPMFFDPPIGPKKDSIVINWAYLKPQNCNY